ncbi:MAG: winged helix-turn-helix domain-containing protein [Holophagaceae bacterium]|nr:winged helix-turn-helix domain-containing protein [Holophagaceae bacterium]
MLLHLVRRSGQLVEKEELMRRVWPGIHVEESSFSHNISVIRKALGRQASGESFIETVSKRGYRFVAPVTSLDRKPQPLCIAVIPFRSLGAANGDDYFGVGLADTLINRLTNLAVLTVRPTSAILTFGGPHQDALEAGRALRVDSVLDGHYQLAGDRLRITVQFIRVSDGKPLWAEKFDARVTDVFEVQDAISEQLAKVLELNLTREQEGMLSRHSTASQESYHLYLKGRHLLRKYAPGTLAIDCLKQALELDQDYALAHAELAFAYIILGPSLMPGGEAMAEAKRAAVRALDLDPDLVEARTTMAMLKFWYDWDRTGSEELYLGLLSRNPNYPMAYGGYGWFLTAMGRFEEAQIVLEKGLALDPLSPTALTDMGLPFYFARQYRSSIEWFERALELDPYFWYGHYRLGISCVMAGDLDRAIPTLQRAQEMMGNVSPDFATALAWAYAMAGNRPEAQGLLTQIGSMEGPNNLGAYDLAAVHLALGDNRRALQLLALAVDRREKWVSWMKVDPRWKRLEAEPSFTDLLARIGLSPSIRTTSKNSGRGK